MTVLETKFYEMATSVFAKYLKKNTDWEQRRYEIAKDLFVHADSNHDEIAAKQAVEAANILINELKKEEK